MFRKNTAGQFIHFQGVDATTGGIKSGVTWTVRRCIDGTFAAAGGTATEDGTTGGYKFALSQADTNGNDIGFNFTGTGAVPQTVNIVTTAADPTDSVRFGLTALPNAAAGATGGLPLAVDNSGRVDVLKINGTSQTARDIGASVLLSSGTGTGQLKLASGYVAMTWADIAAPTTAVNLSGTTIATVTNQLTSAAIATGVWQDATAGDFTAANSIGKSVMNGVALGTGLTVASVAAITASGGIVSADVKKVNAVTVNGDGAATPWGP